MIRIAMQTDTGPARCAATITCLHVFLTRTAAAMRWIAIVRRRARLDAIDHAAENVKHKMAK
ncbi:hypothetical protein [Xanthomonas arboricola]|uniref:Uncharacterized protein n=2 Tax=Xanthomonas arboricola pv. pruni TaxID=69929 RepID=A0AAP4K8S9_9XANT|nr:hypothetical protein [Xanthomonas arboricola]MDN0202644.1 hypothetical protein [Xanthomonas arboricola pv. corylina]MDN0211854.1 hypothetical protein [Xanthomonas arboricola pv. corylina]MDN0237495.1 hypothetical protein [Xanthomonas arboricola pv. juglandis]MDN0249617.1 hypothetical protein [Xanthomonas arboricola pv. juglandis]MDN0265913.1 hypothetical protein [Xanthomonas arboricola pv. pruni]